MEMIVTNKLSKTFKGRKDSVDAVKGVSLHVNKGEIFGFIGPNGAGKTTTMRMLTTLMPPTSGSASVVGFDLFKQAGKIREKIGYVSQKGGCYDLATGFENMVLQGRLYGLTKVKALENAEKLVDAFHMKEYSGRKVSTYSGGQRRHIDLAMGVMHNPPLLFLDEPTTGLDPTSRANFWEHIRRLRDEGVTIFLTTHYLDEADTLCDTICIMDHGSIVAEGSSQDLKRRIAGDIIEIGLNAADIQRAEALVASLSDVKETVISDKMLKFYIEEGEKALPEILPLFVGAKIPILTVALRRPSLDEVFLKMTGYSISSAEEKGEAR
jgi:ABC-2 type transport system ATP-binding protein